MPFFFGEVRAKGPGRFGLNLTPMQAPSLHWALGTHTCLFRLSWDGSALSASSLHGRTCILQQNVSNTLAPSIPSNSTQLQAPGTRGKKKHNTHRDKGCQTWHPKERPNKNRPGTRAIRTYARACVFGGRSGCTWILILFLTMPGEAFVGPESGSTRRSFNLGPAASCLFS